MTSDLITQCDRLWYRPVWSDWCERFSWHRHRLKTAIDRMDGWGVDTDEYGNEHPALETTLDLWTDRSVVDTVRDVWGLSAWRQLRILTLDLHTSCGHTPDIGWSWLTCDGDMGWVYFDEDLVKDPGFFETNPDQAEGIDGMTMYRTVSFGWMRDRDQLPIQPGQSPHQEATVVDDIFDDREVTIHLRPTQVDGLEQTVIEAINPPDGTGVRVLWGPQHRATWSFAFPDHVLWGFFEIDCWTDHGWHDVPSDVRSTVDHVRWQRCEPHGPETSFRITTEMNWDVWDHLADYLDYDPHRAVLLRSMLDSFESKIHDRI